MNKPMVKEQTKKLDTKPDAPRVYLRIDRALVAKVIKARRMLCVGEEVKCG